MDFICISLFLILFYSRPWEWNSFAASLGPVTKVMAIGLAAMLYRKLNDNTLTVKGLVRTPQDWAMVTLIFWICYSNDDWNTAWDQVNSRLGYYLLAAHALTTWRRIETFLWVWMIMIIFICAMGVMGYFGVYDPFGSYQKIHSVWKGRCGLNLAVFANPNAYGHSVVPAIPIIYYLGIFRRFIVIREITAPLFIMPAWALWLTESKGSFLSAGVTTLATMAFGRPKVVQAGILIFAYGSGMSIMLLLPRMGVISNPKQDAGIRGRIKAQAYAWDVLQKQPMGVGFENFLPTHRIDVEVERNLAIKKATYIHEQRRQRRQKLVKKWNAQIRKIERNKQMAPETKEREINQRKSWIDAKRLEEIKRDFEFGKIEWTEVEEYKAVTSHNSYVEVGAELGKKGLYFWLAILYYCLKSLVLARCQTDQQERIRRLMFGIISSYLCSSWATNISYRATFFLQTAVISAFHYHYHNPQDEELVASSETGLQAVPPEGTQVTVAEGGVEESDEVKEPLNRMRLLRSLIVDGVLIYVFYRLVLSGWKHVAFDL